MGVVRNLVVMALAMTAVMVTDRAGAAVEYEIITDVAGDAMGMCVVVTCPLDESKPVADMIAGYASTPGLDFVIDTVFLDIDATIPGFGPEDTMHYTLGFRIGPVDGSPQANLMLRVDRDWRGVPIPGTGAATVNGKDGSAAPTMRASVDPATNRMRLAFSMKEMTRLIDAVCTGCPRFVKGTPVGTFFATSTAYDELGPRVGRSAAYDSSGWNGAWAVL